MSLLNWQRQAFIIPFCLWALKKLLLHKKVYWNSIFLEKYNRTKRFIRKQNKIARIRAKLWKFRLSFKVYEAVSVLKSAQFFEKKFQKFWVFSKSSLHSLIKMKKW